MSETLRKYGAKYNTTFCEFCGLSTDVKPITSFGGINIANGSKYYEMDTNKEYRYDADAKVWYEVSDGGSGGGSATLIEKTITANGTFAAADDDADGYSTVTVNVSGGTGLPKLATPQSIARSANNSKFFIESKSDSTVVVPNEAGGTPFEKYYYIITKPSNRIRFSRDFGTSSYGYILFTASSNDVVLQCYRNAYDGWVDIATNYAFKQGSTYRISYETINRGSSTAFDVEVEIAEYNEPITFTVE